MQTRNFDTFIQNGPYAGEQEMLQAPHMRLAVLGRDYRFMQHSPNYFIVGPAKYMFRLPVPSGDDSISIHLHYGIHGSFDGGTQALLARAQD